jgi:CheY-like chemotaxis protein
MYPFRLNEWLQALQMPPPSILPEPQIVVPTAKHQLRILLVDDHHENLYVLQQQLAALGYQSDTASDAETAYNLCQLQHYQLLITDYQLSGWNGAELAYHLRSYERQYQLAPCQIWVLTGNNTLSCQHECDSSAVDLLLIKPCTLAVLEQQFTLLNDRQAAADEADSYPECIVDIDRELAFNRDALVNTDTIMMFTGPLEPQHLKTTLEQFRQYLCKQQTLLRTAAQQKNRQLLTEIFHNIKSTARYYGSDTLSLMAENNEYAAADPALFNLNEAELARFNNQLNEVIEKFIELEQSYEH